MNVTDRTFLISGGGSGLGAATARKLIEQGARVLIADIDEEKGRKLAGQLGERAHFALTDVVQAQSVQAAIDAAHNYFGALHGAISCAGIALAERTVGRRGPHRVEPFVQTLQVNLIGTFHVMRLAATAMAHNTAGPSGERGVLVNTASIAAFDGQVGQLAYAASKGAIAAMTLPAARDLASIGIRVMTIAPGLFDTPLMAGLPEQTLTTLAAEVPFPPRLGHPEEFAALVIHCIENPMLNGEVIRLDGALRMGAT